MVGTADSALTREVSLNQSVLYREVPLYVLYLYHVHYDAPCSTGGDVSGDLLSTSGTLQFLTGVSQQTLTLSILADDIPEETEVSIRMCLTFPLPHHLCVGVACVYVMYICTYSIMYVRLSVWPKLVAYSSTYVLLSPVTLRVYACRWSVFS